ncbi:hypothetical protein GCM10023079_49830 [Streptomyces chitinivorans]
MPGGRGPAGGAVRSGLSLVPDHSHPCSTFRARIDTYGYLVFEPGEGAAPISTRIRPSSAAVRVAAAVIGPPPAPHLPYGGLMPGS